MKILKLLTPCLVGLVLATSSYAVTTMNTIPWDSDTSTANVFYKSGSSENTILFSSSISHSKEGKQRLYFEVDYDFTTDISPTVSKKDSLGISSLAYRDSLRASTPSSAIMTFNGQAVKMLGFTKRYSDTNNLYFSYTPETITGLNYLVNLFKKSKSPIKVDFRGDTIYIPVMGFTRTWNNHGGNAI